MLKTETLSRSAQRRKREKEQRYRTILSAAETLFATDGYHKAGMEKIADKAEMSVGALYFYFKSKEEILVRLLQEIADKLRILIGGEFKRSGTTFPGFERAGLVFFEEFCVRYPHKLAIIFRESVGKSSTVELQRKRVFTYLIADVRDAIITLHMKHGNNKPDELKAEVAAVSIIGIYERIAYQYLFWHEDEKIMDDVGKIAMDFILGGLRDLVGV